MSQRLKKRLVLVVLFIFPILIYLFFASGVNNFARLPIVSEPIAELDFFDDSPVRLNEKISILSYLGNSPYTKMVELFNLKEKIYDRFNEFDDFQFVVIVGKNTSSEVNLLLQELNRTTKVNTSNWHFVELSNDNLLSHFETLELPYTLDDQFYSPNVFIVDKNRKIRGRDDNKKEKKKFGYDMRSIAEITNRMVDDVKVLLAEYRLELKSNRK